MQPVAIGLSRADRPAPEAIFVGGQALLPSVGRVLGLYGLVCELTVLPAIAPHGDRAGLARQAAASIAAATGIDHPGPTRRPVAAQLRR